MDLNGYLAAEAVMGSTASLEVKASYDRLEGLQTAHDVPCCDTKH